MNREALKNGDHFVLEKGEFLAEKVLQQVLRHDPEILPVANLELDEVVVIGKETGLPTGAIDLLLMDSEGRVVISESGPVLRHRDRYRRPA